MPRRRGARLPTSSAHFPKQFSKTMFTPLSSRAWMKAKGALALHSLPILAALMAQPVQALDLLSAGWSYPPACDGTVSPPVYYGCYEDLTATSITLYGQDSASPPTSTSSAYTLTPSSQQLSVRFNASFDPGGNSDSEAFYSLGSSAPVLFNRTSATGSYVLQLNPGEQLQFSINQVIDASTAGSLRITNFDASPVANPVPTMVPFPLPIGGPIALALGAIRLRRSARSSAAIKPTRQR